MNDVTGSILKLGPARALLLDDPEMVCRVSRGRLDLFVVPVDEHGEPVETGSYLCGLGEGDACFGVPLQTLGGGLRIALRATAPTGTEVTMIPRSALARTLGPDASLTEIVDGWIRAAASRIPGSDVRTDMLIEASDAGRKIGPDLRVGARQGEVVWVRPTKGDLLYCGREAGQIDPLHSPAPIVEPCWAVATGPTEIETRSTAALADGEGGEATLWAAVEQAGLLFVTLAAVRLAEQRELEKARIGRKLRISSGMFAASLGRLAVVLQPKAAEVTEVSDDPLLAAANLVGKSLRIEFTPIPGEDPAVSGAERLDALARAARVNLRKVALTHGWYREDNGPLLCFRKGEGDAAEPVALLPAGTAAYDLVEPAGGKRQRVGPAEAAAFLPTGYMFYRSLPDEPTSVLGIMRFAVAGLGSDIWRVFAMGLLAGILALVTPLFTSTLFSDVLPRSDHANLGAIVLGMAASALGIAAFEVVRSFSLLRIEGHAEANLQTAIWDRLLRLPTGFFRQYTVGDLASRVMNIAAIRQVLTSTVNSTVLDGLFSLVSFALLFYYSWRLALVALGVSLVAIVLTGILSLAQIPHQRSLMRDFGKVEGVTYQMLVAVAKLRVAAAEARAFARWAGLLAEQKQHVYKARRIATLQTVLSQSFPPIASLVIYLCVFELGPTGQDGMAEPLLTVGAYMGFSAAFGQFLAPLMSVVAALTTAVTIVPMYERVGPILKTVPETRMRADPPGRLTGDIEFRRVTFRYLKDAPPVLDDVSWKVGPGEYIAFVGPSGGGKSTVLRLLLGFEQPETGGIFFDHKDLATLDLAEIRRQIGVVMQNAGLMSGSIYDNIVGSLPLSMDDAWEAARMAGFDEDIRQMPMGMQTVLSEAAPSLSGGQKQRLIIARAIVRKPRILVFDEATSALDNRTQAIVNESLTQLNMTRIVVAHRLSTIKGVNRIYVMREGQIVETGGYQELLEANGMFAQLATRQMT